MNQDLTEIKVSLAEIKVDLRHHIKRTELLELEVKEWRNDMKPVQKHVTMVNGAGKLLGTASIITAIAVGIYRLLGV